MIENETLIALPERVETSDFAWVGVTQVNSSLQVVSAPTGAAFGSIAVGSTVADYQANLASVTVVQS